MNFFIRSFYNSGKMTIGWEIIFLCIVFFQFFCFASKHYSELLSSSFSSRGDPPFSSPALSALASKISMLLLKHLRPPSSIQSHLYHVEQCSIHLYWLFFINNCFSILFLTSASAFFFGLPRPFPLWEKIWSNFSQDCMKNQAIEEMTWYPKAAAASPLFPLFQHFSPFCRQSPVVVPCLFSQQGCRPRPRPVPLSSLMPPSHSRLSEASLGLSLPALPPLLLPSSGFVWKWRRWSIHSQPIPALNVCCSPGGSFRRKSKRGVGC